MRISSCVDLPSVRRAQVSLKPRVTGMHRERSPLLADDGSLGPYQERTEREQTGFGACRASGFAVAI